MPRPRLTQAELHAKLKSARTQLARERTEADAAARALELLMTKAEKAGSVTHGEILEAIREGEAAARAGEPAAGGEGAGA